MNNSKIERGILIYGASHDDIDEVFRNAAEQTGRLIGEAGYPLISGGGKGGLMRCAIDGVLSAGGRAIGVLPQFMVERGWQHPGLSKMVIAADMHERKSTMAALAMGVIAFPGGCGTLEELLEIITWRKLGLFAGNIVILNIDGFYDPLLEMLEHTIERRFMLPEHRRLWSVATTPEQAVALVLAPADASPFPQTLS